MSGAEAVLVFIFAAFLALVACAILLSRRKGARSAPKPALNKSPAAQAGNGPDSSIPFQINRLVAEGGMGTIYEAFDPVLQRRVAIKRMRPEIRLDPEGKKAFIREARILAALHHPNIVEIFSVLETKDDLCLVIEFVDGPTVSQMIRSDGRLEFHECLRLVDQVCAALEFAHSRQILHRDLKPSNIMVTAGGSVKVMDFGLARQAQITLSKLSPLGRIAGTMAFMAPEQHLGKDKRPADLFALGATLYQMLAGIQPFEGPYAEFLEQKENMRFIPLTKLVPGLPPGSDGFMRRALAPKPKDRFQTVAEFQAALKEFSP